MRWILSCAAIASIASYLPASIAAPTTKEASQERQSEPTKAETVRFIINRPLGIDDFRYEAGFRAARIEFDDRNLCMMTYRTDLKGGRSMAIVIPMGEISPRDARVSSESDNHYGVVLVGSENREIAKYFRDGKYSGTMSGVTISVGTQANAEKLRKALAHLGKLCGAKDDLF